LRFDKCVRRGESALDPKILFYQKTSYSRTGSLSEISFPTKVFQNFVTGTEVYANLKVYPPEAFFLGGDGVSVKHVLT
jgi:hypothetical protein